MSTPGPDREVRLELGKHLVDKGLLDRADRRSGKVDDLVLELPTPNGDREPRMVALVSGPMAYARSLPRPLAALARRFYRLFGVAEPRPVELDWRSVRLVDVVVRVDVDRSDSGLDRLARAVGERLIRKIPGG